MGMGLGSSWIFRPPEITPNYNKISPKGEQKVQECIYAGLLQTLTHAVPKTRKKMVNFTDMILFFFANNSLSMQA